jgi:hypothetical protein
MAEDSTPRWRMALRREQGLDDVVVNDVEMFRAEMLSPSHLWLACYLPGTGVDGDRVTFEVRVGEGGSLLFDVVERPAGHVVME